MTDTTSGPSLSQAHTNHHHHHNQLQHHHSDSHPHAPQDDGYQYSSEDPHAPPHDELLRPRATGLTSDVTRLVQTISVIQYIDETGSVVSVKTIEPESTSSPTLAQDDVWTSDSAPLETIVPSVSISAALSFSQVSSSSGSPVSTTPAAAVSSTPAAPLISASATGSNSGNLTLTSSFNATALSTGLNSTSTHSLPLSANSAYFLNASAVLTSSPSLSSSWSSWSSSWDSSSSSSTPTSSRHSSTTSEATTTGGGDGNIGGPVFTVAAPPSSTTSSNSASGSTSNVPTEAVVGGVVGGVAGVALIALVLMFFIKWKKQHANGMRLLGDGNSSAGFLSFFGWGGPAGNGGGSMTERSIPFAIPASLAALSGGKRASQAKSEGAESGERGFYKVSGRKLASVLDSGGDGYSEPDNPHMSTISGGTSYRGSMAILSGPNSKPLQLGSPMRPESGLVVMRTGPARTPVHEQGPFDDNNSGGWESPDLLTPPRPDALGRSLTSQAGSVASGGSVSRFTENV